MAGMNAVSATVLAVGFLLTVAGTAMLFLPGPGVLAIAVGAEYAPAQ